MEISGSRAIVTGAGRGIGRAIALRLTAGGARVLVVDRDVGSADAVAGEIRAAGGEALPVGVDLLADGAIADMIDRALAEWGGLDVLVNNAGGYDEPVFPRAPAQHWLHALDLNLRAVMLGIHAALPALERDGGGAVINLASSAGLGLEAHPGPEYATAKAGVIRLTACLAPLAENGVRVNCICPHTVATERVLAGIAELRAAGRPLPEPLAGELIGLDELADVAADMVRDEALAGRVMVMWGGRRPRLLPLDAAW
jgi:NAD(P)-dependent dehydrogenase (short-subunit alcohol dehydrogenase family)